jgi:putative spermidine/putrescine transport system ATP-binding protein
MSDRVAVLNRGHLEQYDTSIAIYDQPATAFVATFVGTANLLPVALRVQGDDCHADFANGATLAIPQAGPWRRAGAALLAVRPEQWEWRLASSRVGVGELLATVQLAMPIGPTLVVDLQLDDGKALKISMPRAQGAALRPGMRLALNLKPDAPVRTFSAQDAGAAGA